MHIEETHKNVFSKPVTKIKHLPLEYVASSVEELTKLCEPLISHLIRMLIMTSLGILPKIECLQWSLDQSWHSTRYVLLSVLYTS